MPLLPARPWLLVALAITLSLGAWLPSIGAGFTADDWAFIVQNPLVRSLDPLAVLGAPFPPTDPDRGLYRPLTALSYSLDHALWGMSAPPWHRTQLLLYGAGVALVFVVARLALGGWGAGLVAALLFCLHPVHAEVVASLTGRSELLGLLFCLASLLALEGWRRAGGAGRLVAAAGLMWLGCLSKETAVVFPAAAAAWVWLREEEGRGGLRRGLIAGAGLAGVSLAHLALRAQVLGRFSPAQAVLGEVGPAERLWTMGRVFLEYVRLLVWPDTLAVDFYYQAGIGVIKGPEPAALVGLGLGAGWVAALLWGLARRDHLGPHGRAALWGGLCFGIFLFPVSHLVPFGALMAERFLFAPSLGVVVAAAAWGAWLWERTPAARGGLLVALALVLAPMSARAWARAQDWRSDVTLYEPLVGLVPDDARILGNLALGYREQGRLEEAVETARRAMKVAAAPGAFVDALGLSLLDLGREEEALAFYREVARRFPGAPHGWMGLGLAEARALNLTAAIFYFERALQQDASHAAATMNLATARANQQKAGRFAQARGGELDQSPDPGLARSLATAWRAVGAWEDEERAWRRYEALTSETAPRLEQARRGPTPQLDMTSPPR